MDPTDLELIDRLIPENEELAALWREHLELETKLEAMSHRPYLTIEEDREVKSLKKVKLAGRDRMEAILREYRGQMETS